MENMNGWDIALVVIAGYVATITLNRPKLFNALDEAAGTALLVIGTGSSRGKGG